MGQKIILEQTAT